MSSVLAKRPSSRSSSRPRTSRHTTEPAGKTSPPHGISGSLKDRRPSASSIGRNETSPTKMTSTVGTKPALPQPTQITSRVAIEPSLPNHKPNPITISNPQSLSQTKATVPATTTASVHTTTISPAVIPKPVSTDITTVSAAKPVPSSQDTKQKASVPTSKPGPVAETTKDRTPAKNDVQTTLSLQPTKTKPTLDPKLSRSPSKPGKTSLISQSSSSPSSPPIDKDIPNLPADRPVRGVDPVFAVAEMVSDEDLPIKEADEISMSTRKEICANTGGAIGNTPLVLLNSIGKGLPGKIAVKLEYMNPAGSVKDRVGFAMIDDAEKRGLIEPGKTVLIEATSGNMGIALAFVARIKGYKLILCMPASMSVERRSLLKAYGAEVVLTDPATAVKGALQRANELKAAIPNAHILNQFGNPANVKAHYNTTGPEIFEQTNGKVDIVCFGVGSGGTLSGVGKYLKEKKPSVEVFPVEPFESSVINGLCHSLHKIQGMGTGFIPEILDKTLFSEALRVHSDDAIAMAKRLATEEAILGGISSGANVCAAVQLASRPENEGKLIVTNINSFGERYLSTTLYSDIREAAEKLTLMSLDESLDIAQKYVANE